MTMHANVRPYGRRVSRLAAVITTAALAGTALVGSSGTIEAAAQTYYVSCRGSDAANGKTAATAWKSLKKASAASLAPGDKLLLRRNCIWTGQRLDAAWRGTAQAPITISNYGPGGIPLIRDGKNSNIKITGRHLVISGLRSHFRPMNRTSCGQSIGTVYGFNLTGGASNVTITQSRSSGATAGIHLARNSSNNRVTDNHIHNNNVMTSFGANPARDLGVWGILVRSDGNEIDGNLIAYNVATCSNQGYKRMSNSVEIYEGSINYIHHNTALGDRVFSELGSSASKKATGNIFEFNIFRTQQVDSRFITTRGSGHSFGPVRGTRVLHNTTNQTGARSQGVVCGGTCTAGILELSNNILVAREKAIYVRGTAKFGPNIAWGGTGDELVQITSAAGKAAAKGKIIVANPRFRKASGGDLRVGSASPAISAANNARVSTIGDLVNRPVRGPGAELGVFEY